MSSGTWRPFCLGLNVLSGRSNTDLGNLHPNIYDHDISLIPTDIMKFFINSFRPRQMDAISQTIFSNAYDRYQCKVCSLLNVSVLVKDAKYTSITSIIPNTSNLIVWPVYSFHADLSRDWIRRHNCQSLFCAKWFNISRTVASIFFNCHCLADYIYIIFTTCITNIPKSRLPLDISFEKHSPNYTACERQRNSDNACKEM